MNVVAFIEIKSSLATRRLGIHINSIIISTHEFLEVSTHYYYYYKNNYYYRIKIIFCYYFQDV